MIQITGQEVFGALMKDKRFSMQSPPLIEVQKPLILDMPNFLQDLLEEKVTFKVISQARITFIKESIAREIVKKYILAMPASAFITHDQDYSADVGQKKFVDAFSEIERLIMENIEEVEGNPKEDRFLVRKTAGLNKETLSLYEKDSLTLGELLVLQPGVIVF